MRKHAVCERCGKMRGLRDNGTFRKHARRTAEGYETRCPGSWTLPTIVRPPPPSGDDIVVAVKLAGTQAVIDAAARSAPARRLELVRQAIQELTAVAQTEADRLTVEAMGAA